jgi:hypothetical protein
LRELDIETRIILKLSSRNNMRRCGLDSCESGYGMVADSGAFGNEISGSKQEENLLTR